MKILVTGSAGFVCGYLIAELLEAGHEVYGIDNFSKYGKIEKSYDDHPRFHFIEGDAKNLGLMTELASECDTVVAAAALVGGISYFHHFAYDLLAENERILASTFDAALWAFKNRKLKKINVVSSSMVYESATCFPTKEGTQQKCPPPASTYGFQKLSSEYFAQGAHEQYGLPFTIVRPFNCVGIGERRALGGPQVLAGNLRLAMSHVVPDLLKKIFQGQNPLHIFGSGHQIRHYTYCGDLAHGIRLCIENPRATNEDFNLSTAVSTTVSQLAEMMWKRIHPNTPFRYVSDPAFKYDVQVRTPDVTKAKVLLGFEARTSLEKTLDEVIPWVKDQVKGGGI